ncbi:hypothetical protein [Frigoriflavimonas asaccharolytica]|uniref:Uncharacterized protein n=1 Tax=Frigoriflavimonas asaccharolytica TaxID=2735899 RepID=A0A8J8G7Y8_9FLAO|nr:hypothetical protein [Frigoriflavimonas asaccharolytica]NRS91602.1 hypothetical protein [Frigoriflavimonas asaccharolytica]
MEIRNLIVKEYLESLTEKDELNKIFPILLEAQGFEILTKPTENLGLKEYGKDIVAIGIDAEDGIKKRFYFELKGGADRDITENKFYGKDGIQDSLAQASYNPFLSAYPQFEKLPLKVVIVHNGTIEGKIQSTLEGMFINLQKSLENTSFERWDISILTKLFTEKLFNAYLLVDTYNVRLFNKTLINLDADENVSKEFHEILENLLSKFQFKGAKLRPNRHNQMLFETLKLISFIIFTESNGYNNLNIAKKYILCLLIKMWHWILKNNLEKDKSVIKYFDQVYQFYFDEVMQSYFEKTLPIALKKDGIYYENAGMYEEMGYNFRAFEFLEFYTIFINYWLINNTSRNDRENARLMLVDIINNNKVCMKPLIDYHSNVIISIINLFLELGDIDSAKSYMKAVIHKIKTRKINNNFLPDANNSMENVIKFRMTGTKPVFYSDSTSPLLSMLFIYVAILDLKAEYYQLREFVSEYKIDLGYFVPHFGINSTSHHLIEDLENDFEEQLFSKSHFNEGYQRDLELQQIDYNNLNERKKLSFSAFKEKILLTKDEFEYVYRTTNSGYPLMKDFAHIYFHTPYFPDTWKNYIERNM